MKQQAKLEYKCRHVIIFAKSTKRRLNILTSVNNNTTNNSIILFLKQLLWDRHCSLSLFNTLNLKNNFMR